MTRSVTKSSMGKSPVEEHKATEARSWLREKRTRSQFALLKLRCRRARGSTFGSPVCRQAGACLRAPTVEFQDGGAEASAACGELSRAAPPSLGSRDRASPRPESRGHEPCSSSALRFARCSLSTGGSAKTKHPASPVAGRGMEASEERRAPHGPPYRMASGRPFGLEPEARDPQSPCKASDQGRGGWAHARGRARRSCVTISTITDLGSRKRFECAAIGGGQGI
jgi:hypothetical protein